MKHAFALLAFALHCALVWSQTDTYLFLEMEAEGASEEDVITVTLESQPAMLDGIATVTLVGDEEHVFSFALPSGTAQGTVTASFVDCEGNAQTTMSFMTYSSPDSSGVTLLSSELELAFCDDEEEEEEEFEGWDDDLNLGELEAYLDSLCDQVFNPDAELYCDLLESIVDCLNGDTLACLEVEEWLDDVEWTWQEDEEEEEESECNAEFAVLQAFGIDSLPIPNVLWVYVYDYDDDNDYFWSFGDEGTSTDPFPTWVYETDGPYELCLTVSNNDDSCSNTYCQTISVDSSGWWTGLVDGFTLSVFDGGTGGSINGLEDLRPEFGVMTLYPNPVQSGTLQMEWMSRQACLARVDVLGMDGRMAMSASWQLDSGWQQKTLDVSELTSGMYLVRISDGVQQHVQRVLIR